MEPDVAAAEIDAGRAGQGGRQCAGGRRGGHLPGRGGAGVAGAMGRESESTRARNLHLLTPGPKIPMPTNSLTTLAADLLSGRIRVVDLTQTLSPEFPQIALPPELGQCWPFRIEEISRYDDRGSAWYWNNCSWGEHTGTHFDAPIHWVQGRDLPNNAPYSLPVQRRIGAACVIDCSARASADPDFLLTADYLEDWEAVHGRIPPRSWVLMRTDWSRRTDPVAYQNYDETGPHTPGPAVDAVRFLVDDRDVAGFGSETIGTDAGQAHHLKPPYPCHYYMQGAGRSNVFRRRQVECPTKAVLQRSRRDPDARRDVRNRNPFGQVVMNVVAGAADVPWGRTIRRLIDRIRVAVRRRTQHDFHQGTRILLAHAFVRQRSRRNRRAMANVGQQYTPGPPQIT